MSEPVTISAEALASLQSRLAMAESSAAAQASEAAARETKAMIDRGDSQAVLDAHRRELTSVREQASKYATRSALAQALSGYSLIPHAAEQLEVIIGGELTATPSGDGFSVHSKDFRSVEAFVADKMASGTYAHFMLQKSGPGTPAAPGRPGQPAPAPAPVPGTPTNLSEYMRASATSNALGGGNQRNSSAPAFLGRHANPRPPMGAAKYPQDR